MDNVTCNSCGSILDCTSVANHMAMHRNQYGYAMPYSTQQYPYQSLGNIQNRPANQSARKRQRDGRQKAGNASASNQNKFVAKQSAGGRRGVNRPTPGASSNNDDDTASNVDDPRTQPNMEHTTACSPYHRVCVWHHTMTECARYGCNSLIEYIRESCAESKSHYCLFIQTKWGR